MTTQMQHALQGKVTQEMQQVAKSENLDVEWIKQEMSP